MPRARDEDHKSDRDEGQRSWKSAFTRSNSRGGTLRKSPSDEQLRLARSREASRAAKARGAQATLQSVPKQDTVPEAPNATIPILGSPKPLSHPHVERLSYSTSETTLLTQTPAELAQALLRLRRENKELKDKIPLRTSSAGKEKQADSSTVSRLRWSKQQDELVASQKKITTLESELQQEKIKYTECEKARKQAVKAQALLTRTDPSSFDDEHFREQVENLQFQVAHWVRNQSWKVPGPSIRGQRQTREKYNFLLPTCPQFLDYFTSKRGIELLMEAHVWQFLVVQIFAQDIWAIPEENNDLSPKSESGNPYADWKKYLGKNKQTRLLYRIANLINSARYRR